MPCEMLFKPISCMVLIPLFVMKMFSRMSFSSISTGTRVSLLGAMIIPVGRSPWIFRFFTW